MSLSDPPTGSSMSRVLNQAALRVMALKGEYLALIQRQYEVNLIPPPRPEPNQA